MENFTRIENPSLMVNKISILGIRIVKLNDWSKIIGNEEYTSGRVTDTEQLSKSVVDTKNPIKILIESKQTIIENVKSVIHHERYLIITFTDDSKSIVTSQGKVIEIEKDIYSKKSGYTFKLIYKRNYNSRGSEFIVVNIKEGKEIGEREIVIINEDGVAIKVDTGMYGRSVKIDKVDGESGTWEGYIILITGYCRLERSRWKITKALYVDKGLKNIRARNDVGVLANKKTNLGVHINGRGT